MYHVSCIMYHVSCIMYHVRLSLPSRAFTANIPRGTGHATHVMSCHVMSCHVGVGLILHGPQLRKLGLNTRLDEGSSSHTYVGLWSSHLTSCHAISCHV